MKLKARTEYRTWGGLASALVKKLERAVTSRFGMPPIAGVEVSSDEVTFIFVDDSKVHFSFKADVREDGYDVWVEWDVYKPNGARASSGTIPIIEGPRRYPRWESTAIVGIRSIVKGMRMARSREAYSYGCIMARLPDPAKSGILEMSAAIPDEFIYDDDDGEMGREDKPHVTVKYGLHTKNPDEVAKVLKGWAPIRIKMGKPSVFHNEGPYVVLKLSISSPDLMRLNKHICHELEFTDKHPEYKPHATVAYVVKDKFDPYYYQRFYDTSLEGVDVVVDELEFSTPEGKRYRIPLTGTFETQVASELASVARMIGG